MFSFKTILTSIIAKYLKTPFTKGYNEQTTNIFVCIFFMKSNIYAKYKHIVNWHVMIIIIIGTNKIFLNKILFLISIYNSVVLSLFLQFSSGLIYFIFFGLYLY